MLKVRRVRIYPSPEQDRTLRAWLGAVRWTYNRTVRALADGVVVGLNLTALRAHSVHNAALDAFPWARAVPYDARDEAVRDVVKAVRSNQAKMRKQKAGGKKGALKKFALGYRRRKDATQESFVVAKKFYLTTRGPWWELFGAGKMRAAEPLPAALQFDARLTRSRLGHYHLCMPVPATVALGSENQAPADHHGVIALDPGVRTFMTGYDADGGVVEWGANDMGRLHRLCGRYDSLCARYSQPTVAHARRWRMRRAALRMQLRIRRLVDDVHCRLARWLCEHYRVVLLPEFRVSEMVIKWDPSRRAGRQRRCIRSRTARNMLTWGHFRFRQRLLAKAREFPACAVVLCDEAYTSKTCGRCGELHAKLGASKVFRCPAAGCGFVADRDASAARNILLRYLTLNNIAAAA